MAKAVAVKTLSAALLAIAALLAWPDQADAWGFSSGSAIVFLPSGSGLVGLCENVQMTMRVAFQDNAGETPANNVRMTLVEVDERDDVIRTVQDGTYGSAISTRPGLATAQATERYCEPTVKRYRLEARYIGGDVPWQFRRRRGVFRTYHH